MTMSYQQIFIASDHAGLEMKQHLVSRLPQLPWVDLGPHSSESVDYPDYADALCKHMKDSGFTGVGVLICGSGQGMAIRANRHSDIRASLCWSEEIAQLSRAHNDANVLCLPGRFLVFAVAEKVLEVFLSTPFEGGRHQRRVDKLGAPCT